MSVHVKRAPGQPATKRKIGLSANTLAQGQRLVAEADAARSAAKAAQASAQASADAAEATVAAQGARLMVLVDAPSAGPWQVGTNDFAVPVASAATVAASVDALTPRILSLVDAPSAGPWQVGTNDFAVPLGGGVDAAYVEAQFDAKTPPDLAASDFGWTVRRASGSLVRFTSQRTAVCFHGDSLLAGYPRPPFDDTNTVPAVVGQQAPGLAVTNIASSGQTAGQAALRSGGIVLVTSADVTLPADTSAVALPVGSVTIQTLFENTYTFPMTLGGVPVTVTQATSTTFTVKRQTAAGTTTLIPAGTPALTTVAKPDAVQIFGAGRNNFNGGLTEANLEARIREAVAATAAMVDALPQTHPGFLVIGTITGTNETRGTLGWRAVTEFNRRLSVLFPAQWWDWRRYLVDQAIYDAGLTPTQADLTAMARDTYPPSLSHDGLHETVAAAAVIGKRLKTELTTRGLI